MLLSDREGREILPLIATEKLRMERNLRSSHSLVLSCRAPGKNRPAAVLSSHANRQAATHFCSQRAGNEEAGRQVGRNIE